MSNTPRRRRGSRSGAAPTPAPAERGAEADVAPAQGARERTRARVLTDGRVQMLVYLPPALVKAVKHAAVEQEVSASHVVEQVLAEWLARRTPLAEGDATTLSRLTTPTPVPRVSRDDDR